LIQGEQTTKTGPFKIYIYHKGYLRYYGYEYTVPSLQLLSQVVQDHFNGISTGIATNQKHVLVCTHGSHDRCCGTFGYPIYKKILDTIKENQLDLNVWRVSHFGGHRFAPTLNIFPDCRYYGHVQSEDVQPLLNHITQGTVYTKRYRGTGTLDRQGQVAELFGWIKYNPQKGKARVLVKRNEKGALIQIQYASGETESYLLTIELDNNGYDLYGSCKDKEKSFFRKYHVSGCNQTNV